MHRRFLIFMLCCASICFSSCIKDLEQEGIYEKTRCFGVVLDSRTALPLQGFRVIGTDGKSDNQVVFTDAKGMFQITVTLDQLANQYSIRFVADSLYNNYTYNLDSVPLGVKEYDMGNIYLVGPSVPEVVTASIVDITANSAHCFARVENTGNSAIVEQGFVYSTMQYPTIDNERATMPFVQSEFDYELSLEPNTTYYVRAYAVNSLGVGYGNQIKIRTLDGLAVVITGNVSHVTTNFALAGGEVLSDAGFDVVARGVCWSISSNPTINHSHTVDGRGLGTFVSRMENLEPNKTYHVRAYAQNSSGIAYGPVVTFSTLSGLPTVTTTTISNVTATSAVSGGNVEDDGGYSVIRRGVCYGTTSNPTISGLHTTDGAGVGEFVSQLTNLTPGSTYYYRAYATNGVGTVYGSQYVFVAW